MLLRSPLDKILPLSYFPGGTAPPWTDLQWNRKGFCYINDEAYAKRYVEYKGRTKSRRQIEAELYKRGVDREIIEQVIGGKEGGETELVEEY